MSHAHIEMVICKDAARFAALHAHCFDLPWSEVSWQSMIEAPHTYAWIATQDGKDIGLCVLRLAVDTADIITLAVHPHARRKGLARTLMHTAEEHAEAAGAEAILLEVAYGNDGAKALYENLGYDVIDTRAAYYATPNGFDDAWVMRKTL